MNFEPSRPNCYPGKDGYQMPIKEGKIEKNQRAQTPTPIATYNVIMKPVEMGDKINITTPQIENKENKDIVYGTQIISTTMNVVPKYEPLSNFPNISLVKTPIQTNFNLQPLSINTYTINKMTDQLGPITAQYQIPMASNYLTPINYESNTKYFKLTNPVSPARTPTHQQKMHVQQQFHVPQSTYDYSNVQARSPLKKIAVYTHQHKPSTFVNNDKEADNIDRGIRSSPMTNKIIIDEDKL